MYLYFSAIRSDYPGSTLRFSEGIWDEAPARHFELFLRKPEYDVCGTNSAPASQWGQLAVDLDLRALPQGFGEIAEFAPGNNAMPFGARDALARLLVETERLVATDSTRKVRLFLVVRT
jgi:hypothetical protein